MSSGTLQHAEQIRTQARQFDFISGMTYDELQSSMEQEVSALVGLTDDNRTYIQSYGSDTAMKLVESWDEATSDVGAYQGLGEFNITKAQKTLTVDQVL